MKKVLIIGLGWQGEKFIKYFLLNNDKYNIVGCCKTSDTKKRIEKKYGINISLDYKSIVRKNYDLIISTVFPTNIQYDIVKYILENTDNKVLIDLPISFDFKALSYLLSFEKLYLFNLEHYTKIFSLIEQNKENILFVEAILLINKNNLKKQDNAKKALLVDKFYMLNNLISLDYKKVKVFYKQVNRQIKDIEFIFKVFLKDNKVLLYKYEDSKGFIMYNKKIEVNNLNYTNILNSLLKNIFSDDYIKINNSYKEKHFKYWSHFIIGL